MDFWGKRVTVLGLGIEGVDLVRFAARRGAYVTVSDAKKADQLAERIEQVADLPVRLSLGGNNPADLLNADIILVSQGVPLNLPGLAEARQRGIPISSMLQLFLDFCPAPVVGVTGSSGKTTTTALVAEMFRSEEVPPFLGGNIGVGLLDHLQELRAYTWAVLEISHTQLQLLNRSPHVASVLNMTPNHLDRFSWDEYRALKSNILRFQGASDYAVLNYDDPETRRLASATPAQALWFTLSDDLPGDGVFVRNGWAHWRFNGYEQRLFALDSLQLRGQHNLANAVAAAAVASACGISPAAIAQAIASFTGVPHRLEFVATIDGVDYYDDSIATTPERTLAALHSFQQPLLLLLGGRDKHLPLAELAREACQRCRAVVTFGEAGPKLEAALTAEANRLPIEKRPRMQRQPTLAEAVEKTRGLAQAGDAVLLSPACTSFDAYNNFEERGQHFRQLVLAMLKEAEPSLP